MSAPWHAIDAGTSFFTVRGDDLERRLVAAVAEIGSGVRKPLMLPHFGDTTYRIEARRKARLAIAPPFEPSWRAISEVSRAPRRLERVATIAVTNSLRITPVAYLGGSAGRAAQTFMREVRAMAELNLYPVRPDEGDVLEQVVSPVAWQPRIAVVAHLHFPDLWDILAEKIASVPAPFDLFVSLTEMAASCADSIAGRFPGAHVGVVENRGYDIGPFMTLLRDGQLDGYDLVCKIHGKKSPYGDGGESLIGREWRTAALEALLGNPAQVRAVIAKFAADPLLGIVGPEQLRLRKRGLARFRALRANAATMRHIGAALGIPFYRLPVDFFAGTMFWARPGALKPLAGLGYAQADFAHVLGERDGTLAHAVERMFNAAAMAAGFRVAGIGRPPAPKLFEVV